MSKRRLISFDWAMKKLLRSNLHFAPLDHDSANYVESKF